MCAYSYYNRNARQHFNDNVFMGFRQVIDAQKGRMHIGENIRKIEKEYSGGAVLVENEVFDKDFRGYTVCLRRKNRKI